MKRSYCSHSEIPYFPITAQPDVWLFPLTVHHSNLPTMTLFETRKSDTLYISYPFLSIAHLTAVPSSLFFSLCFPALIFIRQKNKTKMQFVMTPSNWNAKTFLGWKDYVLCCKAQTLETQLSIYNK